MSLTKCMADECKNLTLSNLEQYGAYCFLHSFMTKKPNSLSERHSKNYYSSVAAQSIFLPTEPLEKPIITETVQKEKLTISPVRKAPLPSVKKNKKLNDMKCCVCEDMDSSDDKMECGHMVCNGCLDYVRSMKCPVCRRMMKGNLITEDVTKDIEKRKSEDDKEKEMDDMNAAEMVAMGLNANEFYN